MWLNPQMPAEILNGKLNFLCSDCNCKWIDTKPKSWTRLSPNSPMGTANNGNIEVYFATHYKNGLNSSPLTTEANENLTEELKIQDWAYQWNMTSHPDWTKQAQEIIFSRNIDKASITFLTTLKLSSVQVNAFGTYSG